MSSGSNWLEEAVLNHFFRNTATTAPTKVFLALYISDPTDADVGMEASGGGYERQQVTFSAPTQVSEQGQIQNETEVRFPVATTNWGTISHFGVRTAATGGNLLAYGAVPMPRQIESGDEAVFRENTLTVTVS